MAKELRKLLTVNITAVGKTIKNMAKVRYHITTTTNIRETGLITNSMDLEPTSNTITALTPVTSKVESTMATEK